MDLAKVVFKLVTRVHVGIYRASGGRLGAKTRGMPVLLLTVAGRRTGVKRTTPVVYVRHAGGYVVAGSAGGSPQEPQWFANLRHASTAVVEVGRTRTEVSVHVAAGVERDALWAEVVAAGPFFQGYQDKVERTLPVAVLTPR